MEPSNDTGWVRLVFALSAVLTPALGLASWSRPLTFDPPGARLVLSGLAIVGLVATFQSEWARRRSRLIGFVYCSGFAAWFIFVAYMQGLTVDDALGLMPIAAIVPTMVESRAQLYGFIAAAALAFLGIGLSIEAQFSPAVTGVLFCASALIIGRANLTRLTLSAALEESNRTLEAAVSERTRQLEASLGRLEAEVAERKAAEQQADAANRAKSDFLATMSHELRTPLNAILGYTELISDDLEDGDLESASSDLERIHGSGRHLLSLIDRILDLTRIEAGTLAPQAVDFDVSALVEQVVRDTERPGSGNTVALDLVPELHVRADAAIVRRVLTNLLDNAQKFTTDGTITVSSRRVEGAPLVEVRDTGIGIPAEALASVFERFSQVDGSRTRVHDGAGLGLAVSRELLEVMGGSIEVRSAPGEGSTFTVRLPGVA